MAMKPSSDNEMRIYLGLQLVSRSFEGKDDSLLCSFSIDIVMAETASVAYDKLNTFGECGSAEEVLFNKKCHRKYLGLIDMLVIDKPSYDYIVATMPCKTFNIEKLAKIKRIVQKNRNYFTKPLYDIERNRLTSHTGFYKPMFSKSTSEQTCWFAAVRCTGVPSCDAKFFTVLFCLDCVLAANPEDAWSKLKIRAKQTAEARSLFSEVLQLMPLYDGYSDYGEFLELAHVFATKRQLLDLMHKYVRKKTETVFKCENMDERTISFNPVFLQWENEYGL